MTITEDKIKRINELARKAKEQVLDKNEKEEQKMLRSEYIDGFKKNIKSHLDNMYVVDENGNKKKIEPKKKNR